MRVAKYTLPPAMRHRRFVLLWAGLIISTAGSQMQTWALLWHMRTLTENPIAVSGIGAARLIPILLFSPIGGIIADRYNRRKVMFAAQLVAMLVALVAWGLTLAGQIHLWHIYLLTAIQAAAVSIDLPARQSIWPNIVPAKDLPSAFSLSSSAFNVGSVVGPGLSGMVIGYEGQHYTYLINAVSFLAVIMALIAIGPVPQAVIPQARRLHESAHSHGMLGWVHTCGQMQRLIEMGAYDEMAVDVLESLSSPPLGDVADLKAAREQLDERLVTRGGVNVDYFYEADLAALRAETRRVLAETRGWRHMIGDTNDSFPPYPRDNILALVEEVRKGGRMLAYPG